MGDLTPITREEYYLARMAGEDVTMPEPITREEEYMKGIAAQIEAGSAELPAVTDEDEGKILAVNASGKWDKADAPTELPAVTTDDNGDILTVVSGAWAKANAPKELPAVTTDDNGDILTVVSGAWAKADAPSTNAFDIFWNSKGTQVASKRESISTGTTTTSSLALSGEMDFTKTFKGILDIASQMGSTVYYAKYLLYKRAGDTTVNASKLYEFGSAIDEISFSLTGGVNPSLPATALNVAMTGTANIGVVITLYSV